MKKAKQAAGKAFGRGSCQYGTFIIKTIKGKKVPCFKPSKELMKFVQS